MKHFVLSIAVVIGAFFAGCQSASPDKFFEQVVLNTNYVADFDPSNFGKRLVDETVEYPNSPATAKKGDEAQQIVQIKIQSVEKALEKIKALSTSDGDAKALQEESIKLFETVLPIYKNEYMAFAKLCDSKGTDEEKTALLQKIEQEHMPKVNGIFDEVYTRGKQYADKHQLNVKWGN
ncbi:hypothetical protein [Sphingobacterium suaedae]|uniref:Lipoprotein n=1 Tax=Sphingobacterium suaedae TaxID=1686402 RepID=A0ABW5KH48_9SPHI